jgi:hypothetical protein
MMWRELSQSLYPNCTFFAPSSVQQIEEAQAALSVVIPSELKSLLLESDGIVDEWKQGPILPAAKIKDLNLDFRSKLGHIYPAFYSRLFIAKGAGGDLWGYKVNADSTVSAPNIYEWEHELAEEEPEENTYSVKADSLRAFLEWHLTRLSTI